MFLSKKALLALLPFFLQVNSQASGTGVTTRYCKYDRALLHFFLLFTPETLALSDHVQEGFLTNCCQVNWILLLLFLVTS
jgi:hypothetical protein